MDLPQKLLRDTARRFVSVDFKNPARLHFDKSVGGREFEKKHLNSTQVKSSTSHRFRGLCNAGCLGPKSWRHQSNVRFCVLFCCIAPLARVLKTEARIRFKLCTIQPTIKANLIKTSHLKAKCHQIANEPFTSSSHLQGLGRRSCWETSLTPLRSGRRAAALEASVPLVAPWQ